MPTFERHQLCSYCEHEYQEHAPANGTCYHEECDCIEFTVDDNLDLDDEDVYILKSCITTQVALIASIQASLAFLTLSPLPREIQIEAYATIMRGLEALMKTISFSSAILEIPIPEPQEAVTEISETRELEKMFKLGDDRFNYGNDAA